MLRESMQTAGKTVAVSSVTRGFDGVDVPHALELAEFAEAVVLRDAPRIHKARERLRAAIGEEAFVDSCAVVAAFHGFTRIADAIGIPYTGAAQGKDVPELRAEVGIDRFYRIAGE